MSRQGIFNNYKGFTLLELVAVLTIIGIITFFIINLSNSEKARNQHRENAQLMDLITSKIRQFYQSKEQLPPPDDNTILNTLLPAEILGMEQKYRLDAWGRYFEYHTASDNDCDEGFEVDGRYADAILISLGHNQQQDYFSDSGQNPCTFSTRGDDVLLGIDLTAEKINIALFKLKVLQEKVAAYDALFAGADNNLDGIVDNITFVGQPAIYDPTSNTCPPTHSFENDPSEGRSTLSSIENEQDISCLPPVVFHIVEFYAMDSGRFEDSDECNPDLPGGYDCDPWNRPFKWGFIERERDDGSLIETSDRRFHQFYSSGPDETIVEDDIIFAGQ